VADVGVVVGELPFVGSPAEVLRAHREAPPPRPPGEKTPPALWAYLERMLAKRPEERFPNAGAALKAMPPEPGASGAAYDPLR